MCSYSFNLAIMLIALMKIEKKYYRFINMVFIFVNNFIFSPSFQTKMNDEIGSLLRMFFIISNKICSLVRKICISLFLFLWSFAVGLDNVKIASIYTILELVCKRHLADADIERQRSSGWLCNRKRPHHNPKIMAAAKY